MSKTINGIEEQTRNRLKVFKIVSKSKSYDEAINKLLDRVGIVVPNNKCVEA